MLESLSLDQLRVFIAVADHGSFSAASRQLRRAQSAMSNAIVNLESALGVSLFDRSGWKPQLTASGQALLIDARAVLARADQFKARAQEIAQGLEAEVSLVVDIMYPMAQLVRLVASFRQTFPRVALRLCTEVLGGVPEKVLSGEYDLGIQGSLPDIAPGLVSHVLQQIALVPVAAGSHPLSGQRAISQTALREQTQIVLTDHRKRTLGRLYSVVSDQRILTADLGSKRAMLQAGLGWGYMPREMVAEDLEHARLVELNLAERDPRTLSMPLHLIYCAKLPLGPARKWLVEILKQA